VQITIDGQPVIGRMEFSALLGLRGRSSFDKRRQRDRSAGRRFPQEFAYIHGHPYWLRSEAEDYAATYTSATITHGLGVRDSHMSPAPRLTA
jgi:hypothetical protein